MKRYVGAIVCVTESDLMQPVTTKGFTKVPKVTFFSYWIRQY